MKKPLISLILTVFVLFATAICAVASGTISTYDTTVHVAENGEAAVSTKIQMTFDQSTTQATFPIGAGKNGTVAGYNADKITITEGNALQVTNEAGFTGSQTFQISYDLMAPVENDGDQQILTLDLLPSGYTYGITDLSYAVTLHQGFETVPTYVGGYRDQIVDNYLDLTQTETTFSGTSLEPLLDHDSLVATLILPADFFDFHSASGLPNLASLALVGFLMLIAGFYWYTALLSFTPPSQHRTLPPESIGAGDFPYFRSMKSPNFTMEILDFATKGILIIHRTGRHTVTLERSTGTAKGLPELKQKALKQLFAKRKLCAVNSREYRSISGKYAGVMGKFWRKSTTSKMAGNPAILRRLSTLACTIAVYGSASVGLSAGNDRHLWLWLYLFIGLILGHFAQYLAKNILQKRWIFTVFSAIAILLLWIIAMEFGGLFTMILALIILILSNYSTISGKRKNSLGEKLTAQSKEYARYLATVTRSELLAELRENGQYFYQIFPYAESIGLGKYLAGQLKNVSLPPCDWFHTDGTPPRTANQFRNQLLIIIAALDGN